MYCFFLNVKSLRLLFLSCMMIFLTPLYSEIDIQTGYKQGSLTWNVAGYQGFPNIISELQWKNLKIFAMAASYNRLTSSGFYGKVSGCYGKILKGTVRDSDYKADNRTQECSRSKSDASNGRVFDLSLAIGRQLIFDKLHLKVIPIIGYSLNEQHLKLQKGMQVIDTEDENTPYPIQGLKSAYNASWHGPFAGFDLNFQATSKINFSASFEYHLTLYNGRGQWNLREDFYRDFKHSALGSGIIASVGTFYQFDMSVSIGMTLKYESFRALEGNERFYSYALENLVANQTLNLVKWQSFSALGFLKYAF